MLESSGTPQTQQLLAASTQSLGTSQLVKSGGRPPVPPEVEPPIVVPLEPPAEEPPAPLPPCSDPLSDSELPPQPTTPDESTNASVVNTRPNMPVVCHDEIAIEQIP
jgi:hypothetical protein